MLKRFFAVAPAALVLVYGLWIGPKYDRYVLPAFDGYVYDAMAETPTVFTLAPWGYRILAPWIVHSFPFPSTAAGFFWLTLVCLVASVFLLGRWLRRLGFPPIAAFFGGMSLAATPPFQDLIDYQVLVDPLSLVVYLAILCELVEPTMLGLAALLAVGALTKEVCLLPALAVPFVLSARMGWTSGLLRSFAVAAPAACLSLLIRTSWPPSSGRGLLAPLPTVLENALAVPWMDAAFFGIATLVGLRGFFRERSMAIRAAAVLLWFGGFFAVLANPYGFASPDLRRIAPFAWAPLLPLVLEGLGVHRNAAPSPSPLLSRRTRDLVAIAGLLGALLLAFQADPYRRASYAELPNPVTFLARSRETLKTARSLNEGQSLIFDSRSGRFAGPILERFNLTEGRRHRWFLLEGFGPDAVFESGAPSFQGAAQLLLPILQPRPLTLSIQFEGREDADIGIAVAGQEGTSIRPGEPGATVEVPSNLLVRGDNIVRLRGPAGITIRLIRFEVRLQEVGPRQP